MAQAQDHLFGGDSRGTDDFRIVRVGPTTYLKRLQKDGIQFTVREAGGTFNTTEHKFLDFTGKENIENGRGRITVRHVPNRGLDAEKACTDSGFQVDRVLTTGEAIYCSFAANDITLPRLQALFFSSSVLYIEPNPRISVGALH